MHAPRISERSSSLLLAAAVDKDGGIAARALVAVGDTADSFFSPSDSNSPVKRPWLRGKGTLGEWVSEWVGECGVY